MADEPMPIADRLNKDGPTEEDYGRMNRLYARFPRSYYGDPFLTSLDGRWLLCIESEGGAGSWREVSSEFARAWALEFLGEADDA